MRQQEKSAWNEAIELTLKLFEEWIENGREPQEFIDKLRDHKVWS